MPKPRTVAHSSAENLRTESTARIFAVIEETLKSDHDVHVSLTGGTMGIAVLEELSRREDLHTIDFSRVHFWWSDERFVPSGDQDRNAQQAYNALLGQLNVPAENVHVMGSSTDFESAEAAAENYRAELAKHAVDGVTPVFDLTLLGMGPDGHIASLFPHRDEILAEQDVALAVHDSPKPPPHRVTLTRPVINKSQRIWFLISGSDKAEATDRLVQAANLDEDEITSQMLTETPAAGARGRQETLILATEDALKG